METPKQPDQPYIEQYDIESNEGYIFRFRHDNVFIVLYDDPEWQCCNHMLHLSEEYGPLYMFDCQVAMDMLVEKGWDWLPVDAEPTAIVKQAYADSERGDIDNLRPEDFRD